MPTQSNGIEPVVVMVLGVNGEPLTSKTDIKLKIRRISDGRYFDWTDNTFKSAVFVVEMLTVLQEISSVYSPGEYFLNKTGHQNGFNVNSIVNPIYDDIYFIIADQDGGTDAANLPQVGELKSGMFAVDDRYPIVF